MTDTAATGQPDGTIHDDPIVEHPRPHARRRAFLRTVKIIATIAVLYFIVPGHPRPPQTRPASSAR